MSKPLSTRIWKRTETEDQLKSERDSLKRTTALWEEVLEGRRGISRIDRILLSRGARVSILALFLDKMRLGNQTNIMDMGQDVIPQRGELRITVEHSFVKFYFQKLNLQHQWLVLMRECFTICEHNLDNLQLLSNNVLKLYVQEFLYRNIDRGISLLDHSNLQRCSQLK